ncbi:MAG: 30S ribosomal protein S6 [Omnitrophica WOR_2 bacterium RIFCSPHIGHO2_01_FULL_49_10]|nr:MAG: 30S ribosomal protein S6 [Omnitrophica WOR_2 bacterium RIFCSPHIGHO2_01_FULL_49_10]OGX32981.1 MAG: 30S ribosomal protein S6 [Omnitrophica WOR_2 bacterium RIFCSPLOWO2_02_FULL_50_19]
MKKYEGLFILKPNLSDEEYGKLTAAVVEVITKNGGKVDGKEEMGTKDLAYPIKKEKKGRYFLVYFTAEPQSITAIERLYKINESVLRAVIFIHEVPA